MAIALGDLSRRPGRRIPLRFNTAIWWRSAIASNTSSVRLLASLRVTETVSSLGVVRHATYRQPFEITNKSRRIKF